MKLRALVGCWLAAWIGVVALLATLAPLWAQFHEQAGFALRRGTKDTLQLGEALASPAGLLAFTLALALGLLPLRLARGSPALAWWFGGGALMALLLGVFAWLLLEAPLVSAHGSLGPPSPFQRAVQARPGPILAMIVFGPSPLVWLVLLLVGWGWLGASIHLHRRPPASLLVEARRAAVMCSFPALLLGPLALVAYRGSAPGSLLVSPPFAAAGTVVVVLYGAALWLRLRRPAHGLGAPSTR